MPEMPGYEDYDDTERVERGWCDVYEVHDAHHYVALNGNVYRCSGLTAVALAELEAYDPGTCEHGLSADLCAGPYHYPPDR